jgi:hypothetical protein
MPEPLGKPAFEMTIRYEERGREKFNVLNNADVEDRDGVKDKYSHPRQHTNPSRFDLRFFCGGAIQPLFLKRL